MSYKRITNRPSKIKVNYNILTDWLKYIKGKLEKDYLLFTLDETSFGRFDLRRYGWGIKGQKVSNKFSSMVSFTLLCCICPTGVVAYKFFKGGNDKLIFRDFLESVFQSLLFNFRDKKVVIILDNLPVHLSDFVKKVVLQTRMIMLYNLTKNSRSNPIEYFFGYIKDKVKDETYRNFVDYAQNIIDIMKSMKSKVFQTFYRQAFKNSYFIL